MKLSGMLAEARSVWLTDFIQVTSRTFSALKLLPVVRCLTLLQGFSRDDL